MDGKIGKPILSTDVRAGELNLRYIEGHWVLAMFNEQRMAIEVRISREIDTDWNAIKPADVVVSGPWNQTQDENNFSQLYGAYIVPGSTLGHMDLVVSQWKTSDDSRYNSTQFNVKGLDKFFGVTPQTNTMLRMAPQMDESARGNQDVIEVSETPSTELQQQSAATQGESVETLPEDITIVPLR